MTNNCRLYLITPPLISDPARFVENLKAALGGGDIACLQLRLKSPDGIAASDEEILRAADSIQLLLQEADVHFLINDRPDLARRAGADGVHIGQKDAAYTEARALLGPKATIGVTCHNSTDLAIKAGEAGADYVAFGTFFPTRTKETSARAGIALIENWSFATNVPCVAIGGITSENCGPIVAAGADFIAVSSAVWDAPAGAESAVRRLNQAIRCAV